MVGQQDNKLFPVSVGAVEILTHNLENLLIKFTDDELKITEYAALLIAKYSERHRAYHNLSHIKSLLETAEIFKDKFKDYDCVRLAIWFHDVIYEPKSATNEINSANFAVESLSELNFPKTEIECVEKMILATQTHDASGLNFDGKLFLDLDLGILGAKNETYKKYAQAIRREYSFAPENLYRNKRRIILQKFLERNFIFYTKELRDLLEQQARVNIENEIKELS